MTKPASNLLLNPAVRAVVIKMAGLPFDAEGHKTDVPGIADCLEDLFALLGNEDVGEVVATAVSNGLMTQEQGREVLGIAIWSGQTNGAQLQPTLERWLEAADEPMHIGLALAQGIFPFRDIDRMTEVFARIIERFPEYAATCQGMVRRRREQGG
jgi:hypothetical protein